MECISEREKSGPVIRRFGYIGSLFLARNLVIELWKQKQKYRRVKYLTKFGGLNKCLSERGGNRCVCVYFSDSKLSQLLMDVMSGNCKTTVMTCLRPHCDPSVLATILRVSTHFSRCRTFPIMNDAFGQVLESFGVWCPTIFVFKSR